MIREASPGLICAALLLGHSFLGQAQETAPGGVARAIRESVQTQKVPVTVALDSMKLLGDAADELRGPNVDQYLSAMLRHRDSAIRMQAATTIGKIGVRPFDADNAVGRLAAALKTEKDDNVRVAILNSLLQLRPFTKSQLATFCTLMKDPNSGIRLGALANLGYFASENKEVLAVLVSALDDPDPGVVAISPGFNSISWNAARLLAECKTAARDAAPKLRQIIEQKKGNDEFRRRVLRTLAAVTPEDPLPLITAQEWLTHSQNPKDLVAGAILLQELGPRGKSAVPQLVSILKMPPFRDRDMDGELRRCVLSTLRLMGPAAKEALPYLKELANTDDITTRQNVVPVIAAIEAKE
jgi:HEAT repeat protein